MTACHYSPEQIEHLQMVDVINLLGYWREWPPTHVILKIVHEIEPSAKKEEEKKPIDPNDPSGIGGLLAQFPGGAVTF